MKVPFSWLKELVDIDVTAQELEEKLFSCGFEVEELIPLDAGISKVVVGRIVEMEPKPEYSSGSMLQFSRTLRLTTPPPSTSIQPVCLHRGQPLPWHSKQLTSTSTLGSVNGK